MSPGVHASKVDRMRDKSGPIMQHLIRLDRGAQAGSQHQRIATLENLRQCPELLEDPGQIRHESSISVLEFV